jgi:hypothetical protein
MVHALTPRTPHHSIHRFNHLKLPNLQVTYLVHALTPHLSIHRFNHLKLPNLQVMYMVHALTPLTPHRSIRRFNRLKVPNLQVTYMVCALTPLLSIHRRFNNPKVPNLQVTYKVHQQNKNLYQQVSNEAVPSDRLGATSTQLKIDQIKKFVTEVSAHLVI